MDQGIDVKNLWTLKDKINTQLSLFADDVVKYL